MRPEVQVLPGPPSALTSETLVIVSGVSLDGGVPDQEFLPGYRSWSWMCCSTSPHRPVEAPNRPVDCHPRSENSPSGPSTTCLAGLTRPTLTAPLATGRSRPPRRRTRRPLRLRVSRPGRARQALPAGSTVEPRCGSGLAVPADSVGWLEPGNQAKGGEASCAAGRRAGPGRSPSRPDRGSTRPTDAPAGRSPTTPVRAPRRPATGAAGRAASTAGRSTTTATCNTWSTAPGQWRRSWTGCGRPRGR